MQKLAAARTCARDVAEQLNYADLDALYAAIGEHHVSASRSPAGCAATCRRAARRRGAAAGHGPPAVARAPGRRTDRGARRGLDDVMVRLSRCCTPVPGDEIMGFVTRGRGVSVHRTDCANAVVAGGRPDATASSTSSGTPTRAPATSSPPSRSRRSTGPGCCATCRPGARRAPRQHPRLHTSTGDDRIARLRFDFELGDPSHLDSLLGRSKRIDWSTTPTGSCPASAAWPDRSAAAAGCAGNGSAAVADTVRPRGAPSRSSPPRHPRHPAARSGRVAGARRRLRRRVRSRPATAW